MEKYFIHIPRTGGTSVASSLPYGCAIYLGHDLRDPNYRHPSTICTDEDFTFSLVRDPYDRLVSCYDFLRKGGNSDDDRRDAEAVGITTLDFREFVADRLADAATWQIHLRPQSYYLKGVPAPRIYNFDSKEAAFFEICSAVGVDPDSPLEHHNKGERSQAIGDYYDDDTREMVAEVYREDFALLRELGFATD